MVNSTSISSFLVIIALILFLIIFFSWMYIKIFEKQLKHFFECPPEGMPLLRARSLTEAENKIFKKFRKNFCFALFSAMFSLVLGYFFISQRLNFQTAIMMFILGGSVIWQNKQITLQLNFFKNGVYLFFSKNPIDTKSYGFILDLADFPFKRKLKKIYWCFTLAIFSTYLIAFILILGAFLSIIKS